MNVEEMQSMMPEMMEKMCASMTADDKKEIMMGMMTKMKEGVDMKEMMPEMMQCCGEEGESMMPEMMLKVMMPHCIKMMMPDISKDKRFALASNMVGTLMEQASIDMSDEEKATFVAKIVETIVLKTIKA